MLFARPGPLVNKRCRWLLAALVVAPAPALAGPLAPGDGSWASNPVLFSPVSIADEADWTPVAPGEEVDPFYDIDWSLGTRGSFIRDDSGSRYQAAFTPSASLSHVGKLLSFGGTASGEFTKTGGGPVNIDELLLSGTSTYEVDPFAKLESNASVAMTQEDPNAPDVGADVATTPVEFSASLDAAYTRRFGRLNATLKGNAARDNYGPTTLTDGTSIDNLEQNNTRFGSGLRLGYQLTPVVELFADGELQRTVFDAPSAVLGTRLDGNLYTIRTGVAAQWGTTLSGTASIGVGVEQFDDPRLAAVRATLYDASLTYKPTETLSLTGSFATSLGAPGPNGAGTARIGYEAAAAATYRVNDWLDWRASAGWNRADYADTTISDTGYSLGVGADYLVSRRVKLSADYSFEHDRITPNPATDTQTVSVGLTVQK